MAAKEVLKLIDEKKFHEARAILEEMNPVDIASVFEELDAEETVKLFRILPKETAAEAFAYMTPEVQQNVITALTDKELRAVLDTLYMDDTIDMIEEMPANVVKRVLKVSDSETRGTINMLLRYDEDSAGSIMTTEFIDLKQDMTVKEAFERIRAIGVDKETIYTCYVTNGNRVLEGVVTVKELLLSDYDKRIGDIMEENVLFARTSDDQEHIAGLFRKYDLLSLPVVDNEQRLVGIITIDDAVDVMQEENTEDFEKMAALSPSEDTYLKTPSFVHAKKRLGWLLILMISATITGGIISHYEEAFDAIPLLVSFIPMLMDTGGNCGAQSSTLIIRGMALGEIRLRDVFRVLFKEFKVSLMVGAALAVLNTIWIYIRYHSMPIALTVGVSLLCTVCISKAIGCMLPMVAKKVKLDPAIMAAPLITTIVDACSIFVYFNVALALLKI